MEKLTDFKPIRQLDLPGLENLICNGLIVIVGPNSSGKSQLLRDIKETISGEPRSLVVANNLQIDTPDHANFLKCLKTEGYIYSLWDDNDQEQFIPTTTFLGTGQSSQNVDSQQLEQWRSRSAQAETRKRKNEYFGWLSGFLVTALFLENRLTSLKSVGTIDFETQPPNHDLHALHLSDTARSVLTAETQRAFSKAVWSDISRGNTLCLRVSEGGQVPDAETRHSVKEMAQYRTIEDEGDGMKSYVATAISLLLGRRPISVIDEPELCLHPPQAYNLGQFIGQEGTSPQTATFIATHSSQILRGIIQTAESLQIIRLTRSKDGFLARLVRSEILDSAMKKPTVRAETVLDGIFSQAVAIVEADGDRIVYQAAWEIIGGERNFDIHFATVGGTGGIADTCQMYRILGIPIAVVADLDLLIDSSKLAQVISSLCDDVDKCAKLLGAATAIAEKLKRLPPTISESEIGQQLNTLGSRTYDWGAGDDHQLLQDLGAISSSLNRMHHLKAGGLNSLPIDLSTELGPLLSQFQDEGLFLVPVGELEQWLSGAALSASKRKKWAWANEAAEYIRTHNPEENDIWSFTEHLGEYLTSQFE